MPRDRRDQRVVAVARAGGSRTRRAQGTRRAGASRTAMRCVATSARAQGLESRTGRRADAKAARGWGGSSVRRSHLLKTSRRGVRSSSSSCKNRIDRSRADAASRDSLASSTCTSRSASSSSSSVARNALTSSFGSAVMKPTVSARRMLRSGAEIDAAQRRIERREGPVGDERVALRASALSSDDLPTLV